MNAEARLSSRDIETISESYEDTISKDTLCEVVLEADSVYEEQLQSYL